MLTFVATVKTAQGQATIWLGIDTLIANILVIIVIQTVEHPKGALGQLLLGK